MGATEAAPTAIEFREWPKIARWERPVVITEKIDGTNACVVIAEAGGIQRPTIGTPVSLAMDQGGRYWSPVGQNLPGILVESGGVACVVAAQSRSRIIAPGRGTDNHGFAGWVREHAQELADGLGPGYHYGEWWGCGIQRRYGLDHKRFSLFNVDRWSDDSGARPACCHVVPVLWRGTMLGAAHAVELAVHALRGDGSVASPGFMNPEGVVVFHYAGRTSFKRTLEKDETPKALAA